MLEGRFTVKSVSLLWSVTSALLSKRAPQGVGWGVLQMSQGPSGSYIEHCLEVGVTLEMGVFKHVVCDVTTAAKNNPGEIQSCRGEERRH